MSTAYQFWLSSLKRQLAHPDALQCTGLGNVSADDVIAAWHAHGFSSKRIAKELNNRYRSGYLERKQMLEAERQAKEQVTG